MKQYIKNGELYDGTAIKTDDIIIQNPTEEDLENAGYIKRYIPQGEVEEDLEIENLTEEQLIEHGYIPAYIHKITCEEYIDGPVTIYGQWITNPTEEILLENGYVEYTEEPEEVVAPDLTDEEKLELAKKLRISDIEFRDSSRAINNFVVNGTINHWLTPAERTNYKNSVEAAKLLGLTELSFYLGDTLITLSVEKAEKALAAIQLYADQCYLVTKSHMIAINNMNSIEDVWNYDITQGYPQQLSFNTENQESIQETV